jgi:hypothetical protein
MKDLTNKRFGRWIVIGFSHKGKAGHNYWKLKCDCGNEGITNAYCLTSGQSKSCGCLRDELKKINATTHGKTNTLTYRSWWYMIQRCRNPKNKWSIDKALNTKVQKRTY